MFDKVRATTVMVTEFEGWDEVRIKFEKHPKGGGVNVYLNGNEVDYFTNYEIGEDEMKFETACREYLKEHYGN